jgi:hypothetical protein
MDFSNTSLYFWILLSLILSLLITYWLFKNVVWIKELSKKYKILLYTLRFLGLFFTFLVIANLFFEKTIYRNEKPLLIALIDNSESMQNYSDSSSVKKSILQLQENIQSKLGNKIDFVSYTIGENVKRNKELLFNESSSNLSEGFGEIGTKYYNRNIGAIILVSDGNFNAGMNPIYTANQIPHAPIYTLGVGDTILKKDLSIRDISFNEVTFLKNKFPIEVEIEASKVKNQNVLISLIHNNKTIQTKQLKIDSENSVLTSTFEVDANEVGIQNYTIQIQSIPNEYTTINNTKSISIEVIDNRSKILLISGSPHPDVSALKSVLDTYQNFECKLLYTNKWDEKTNEFDLIICYEPGYLYSPNQLKSLSNFRKSIFYFIGTNSSVAEVNKLDLGFNISKTNQFDEVQPYFTSDLSILDLSETTINSINNFPPVYSKYGNLKFNSTIEKLLNQKIGTLETNKPLLFFNSNNSIKNGVFYGEGIWKWKLHEYSLTKKNEHFNDLFQKVFNYLLLKENKSPLHIEFPKQISSKEDLIVKATFYNPLFELITTPKINFEVYDEKNKKSFFAFTPKNKSYSLTLGKLKPGTYHWKAFTSHKGKNYTRKGTFLVSNTTLEKIETRANHIVLRKIALNSNADFALLKEHNALITKLDNREDITTISYEETEKKPLIDYVILLFIISALFFSEWFIRKWFGTY